MSVALLVTVICKCTDGQTLQSGLAEDDWHKLNQEFFSEIRISPSEQIITRTSVFHIKHIQQEFSHLY